MGHEEKAWWTHHWSAAPTKNEQSNVQSLRVVIERKMSKRPTKSVPLRLLVSQSSICRPATSPRGPNKRNDDGEHQTLPITQEIYDESFAKTAERSEAVTNREGDGPVKQSKEEMNSDSTKPPARVVEKPNRSTMKRTEEEEEEKTERNINNMERLSRYFCGCVIPDTGSENKRNHR